MARAGKTAGDGHEPVLLLVGESAAHRRLIRAHLAAPTTARGRAGADRRRFRVMTATSGAEALRRATRRVTVAAVELVPTRRDGLALVRALRAHRPELAILAFTRGPTASDAMAAVLAGADLFHEIEDDLEPGAFARALVLALERRRLATLVHETEAAADRARARLTQLSELPGGGGGLRPPTAKEEVVPFKEAARSYLTASARLFEGDTRGLARALGVSYFALRRLLARYQVPLPSRSRKQGTGAP